MQNLSGGFYYMAKSKVMLFEADEKMGMRCTFIGERYKIVSHTYVTGNGLLLEIKKHNPDVVFLDSDLYAKIDEIETTQVIRCQYGVPIYYI
jgi:hypothetical protein